MMSSCPLWRYSPECSIYVGGLEGEDEIWPEQHPGELIHRSWWFWPTTFKCNVRLYEHFKECGEAVRIVSCCACYDFCSRQSRHPKRKTKQIYRSMHRFRLQTGEASLYQD